MVCFGHSNIKSRNLQIVKYYNKLEDMYEVGTENFFYENLRQKWNTDARHPYDLCFQARKMTVVDLVELSNLQRKNKTSKKNILKIKVDGVRICDYKCI